MRVSPVVRMTRLSCGAFFILLLAANVRARAAGTPDSLRDVLLDMAVDALPAYKFGESRVSVSVVEAAAREVLADPPRRAELNLRLAGILGLVDATRESKEAICRILAVSGGAESVPALAGLLADPATVDLALIALESIPGPEATAAIRGALAPATGPARLALINSLGERREPGLSADLAKIALGDDRDEALAAVAALGRTGGPTADEALKSLFRGDREELRDAAASSMILRAEAAAEAGDTAGASERYFAILIDAADNHVRLAALDGLARMGDIKAVDPLLALIAGADEELDKLSVFLDEDVAAEASQQVSRMSGSAARILVRLKGEDATASLAASIPGQPPAVQVVLIGVLAERGDRAALPAVLQAARSDEPAVRLAALATLGDLGDASVVDFLFAEAGTGDTDEAKVAGESLSRLRGDDVDRAIAAILSPPPAEVRARAIGALAQRRSHAALPALLRSLDDPAAEIRADAWKALGEIARPDDAAALVGRLATDLAAAERDAAEAALLRVNKRAGGEGPILDLLIDEAPDAAAGPVAARGAASHLRVIGGIGGEEALKALRRSLKSGVNEVRGAAVAALSAWPDPAPAEDLLAAFNLEREPDLRALALGGHAGHMASDPARKPRERLEAVRALLPLAKTDAEKSAVVRALGRVDHPEALALAREFFSEDGIRDAAFAAATDTAARISGSAPTESKEAMQVVALRTGDAGLAARAKEIIAAVERFEDYITAWEVAGPYTRPETSGSALFGIAFDPEPEVGRPAEWKLMPAGTSRVRPWLIDFDRVMKGENRAAYLRTNVWSPTAQKARLELGSDDGIKVWLNGALVHSNNQGRSVTPGEDVAAVELREGWNALLMKVTNGGGDWGACARLRAPDGSALKGLKTRVDGD